MNIVVSNTFGSQCSACVFVFGTQVAGALEKLPENTIFFATTSDDETGKMLLRRSFKLYCF